jgi:hypothetical protein
MKEVVYKKIYAVAMVILVASLALMLFILGVTPFGISAVWAESGLGSSLVVVRPDVSLQAGQVAVASAETLGKVNMYHVQDTVRQGGALHYRVSDTSVTSQELVTMPAQDLGRVVILSVPFVGVWVRVLNDTLGMLALIGLPFFMLLINSMLLTGRRLLPILQVFENSAKQNKRKKVKEKIRASEEIIIERPQASTPTENDMVTILKPYNMRQKYGM